MKNVGITCTTIFHYVHFKWIEQELTANGYSVEYIIYTPRHVNERFERLENYFEENSVRYSTFEQLLNGENNLDVILAPYYLPGFQLLDSKVKKVRVLYGYAKDRWNYAEWNAGFDLVLNYGPYAEKRLSSYTKVVNIGHPRQRKCYKKTIVDIEGKEFSKSIRKKPILLYCPTWADLSSMETFVMNLESFKDKYSILVKLHHGNVLSDNTKVWESLKEVENLYLFDEHIDLFDLLAHSDVVLSDYSGAIFDAMLFRKPIVLIDTLEESVKDTGTVNIDTMQNIALYSKDKEAISNYSLDILVRDLLPHARSAKEIQQLVSQSLLEEQVPYEKLLKELYSFEDSEAPKRAVHAINRLLKSSSSIRKSEEYFIIDTVKTQSFLKENSGIPISIWGAGEMGQVILSWLIGRGVRVENIYDIDGEKQGQTVQGLEIMKPEANGKILITVANHQKSIKETLSGSGLEEGIDFISIFK